MGFNFSSSSSLPTLFWLKLKPLQTKQLLGLLELNSWHLMLLIISLTYLLSYVLEMYDMSLGSCDGRHGLAGFKPGDLPKVSCPRLWGRILGMKLN